MSDDIAIRVENLSKRYEIGELVTMRDLPRPGNALSPTHYDSLSGGPTTTIYRAQGAHVGGEPGGHGP